MAYTIEQYEGYENAIIERIQRDGVDVSALPHVDVLNEALQTDRPQLFVIYNGSDYAEPEELALIVQAETMHFEIFICSRNRQGEAGVFDLYRHITTRLLGYKPAGARTKIAFNNFKYVSGLQNNWQYALTFSFTGYAVEQPDEEAYTLIKDINNNIKDT
jgi:hypothetical protein